MANTKMTETEKLVAVVVFGGMVFMAFWSGYASFLAFNGTMPHLSYAAVPLAIISGLMVTMTIAGIIFLRKAKS